VFIPIIITLLSKGGDQLHELLGDHSFFPSCTHSHTPPDSPIDPSSYASWLGKGNRVAEELATG
jgi:hypothetical protein